MICVSVCEEKTQSEKYLDIDKSDVILMANEGECAVGEVSFDITDDGANITALKYDDEFVCELLLRSVANYAERRGIERITSDIAEPAGIFAIVGFRLIDGQMTIATDNVVHICKSCAESGK